MFFERLVKTQSLVVLSCGVSSVSSRIFVFVNLISAVFSQFWSTKQPTSKLCLDDNVYGDINCSVVEARKH